MEQRFLTPFFCRVGARNTWKTCLRELQVELGLLDVRLRRQNLSPLRSAMRRSRRLPYRRVLDDLRDLPRMRQERDVARRDLARRRADPLRVEPLELRVDCPVL